VQMSSTRWLLHMDRLITALPVKVCFECKNASRLTNRVPLHPVTPLSYGGVTPPCRIIRSFHSSSRLGPHFWYIFHQSVGTRTMISPLEILLFPLFASGVLDFQRPCASHTTRPAAWARGRPKTVCRATVRSWWIKSKQIPSSEP
jgi:hypothetical protein